MENFCNENWAKRIVRDLGILTEKAKNLYHLPGTILMVVKNDNQKTIGILVRMPDKEVGFFPTEADIRIGSKIKDQIKDPEFLAKDQELHLFIWSLLRDRYPLIHAVWLLRTVNNLLSPNIEKGKIHFPTLSKWLYIDKATRGDGKTINIIRKEIEKDGLLGMVRFNHLAVK
jgi:hypothetical protein